MPAKWLVLVNIQILLETLYLPFTSSNTFILLAWKNYFYDHFWDWEKLVEFSCFESKKAKSNCDVFCDVAPRI